MNKFTYQILAVFVFGLLMGGSTAAAPLETAFTFQGALDQSGSPANGSFDFEAALFDAATGGTQVGSTLTVENATVADGLFALELNFGTAVIGNQQLWLRLGVRDGASTGAFDTLAPRTKVTAAPFSLYSLSAGVAESLALGNVITVAKVGGDFASVAAALASISDAAADNPYLVQVAAGEFVETELVSVPAYVHLKGSGSGATIVTSDRNGAAIGTDAATVQMAGNSQVSDLTIENRGDTGNFAMGVIMFDDVIDRNALLQDVNVEVSGTGGVGHFAVYLADAEPLIRRVRLRAAGAIGFETAVNAALASVNAQGGGFPQATISDSVLLGAEDDETSCTDPTGTGFGMQLSESSPYVVNSLICGGYRGISSAINGNVSIRDSDVRVSSSGSAALFEITASGSIRVAHSSLQYFGAGNKFTGAGSGLICVGNYSFGTFSALTDGNNATIACN